MKKNICLGLAAIMTMAFVSVASAQISTDENGEKHYIPASESAAPHKGSYQPWDLWDMTEDEWNIMLGFK